MTLAERKQLLTQRAAIYRDLIATERLIIQARCSSVPAFLGSQRGLFVAGAAVVGWLLARRAGGVLRWLPIAMSAWRIFQNLKSDSKLPRHPSA